MVQLSILTLIFKYKNVQKLTIYRIYSQEEGINMFHVSTIFISAFIFKGWDSAVDKLSLNVCALKQRECSFKDTCPGM